MKTFLSIILLISLPAFAQKGPPQISCEVPTFEFGTRDISEHVVHTFVIKNVGQTPLNINRVKPACGCTLAEISTKLVPPGGSSLITADLDLSKGKAGVQNKAMTVYSDDPLTPTLQLSLNGIASSVIMFSPTTIILGDLETGQIITKVVTMTNSGTKPVTIKSVEAQNNLVVSEVETVRAGFEYLIKISNSGTLPAGRVTDFLTITTDSKETPTQRITVSGSILDKLKVSPKEFAFVEGETLSRTIIIGPGSVKEFNVLSATWPGSGATFEDTKSLKQNGFSISFKDLTMKKELDGSEIIIKTDVEDFEEIRIPVKVSTPPTPQLELPIPPK